MKKNNFKKVLIIECIFLIILSVFLCFFIYLKHEFNQTKKSIKVNLEKLKELKNEVYFDPKYEEDINIIESEYKNIVKIIGINELTSIRKESSKMYDKINEEIKNYNELYKNIQSEIELCDNLRNNYFAKNYDTSKLTISRDNAENILNESNYLEYEKIHSDLSGQNKVLEQFIAEEETKIYNQPTEFGIGTEYPFALNKDNLVAPWGFHPLIKQNSKHPTWVLCNEPDVTDRPPTVNLFINDSSADYFYDIHDIPIKEITVENESGEMQIALVNTEIAFSQDEQFGYDEYRVLNERPGYFFVNKNGEIELALKNYDNEEYYVLYSKDDNFE